MFEYLNANHIITNIVLAVFVPAGSGNAIHKNRQSHGLALNCDGTKKYLFENGKVLIVKENDIIYLPKNSNYEVISIKPGGIYCINFQCLEEKTFSPFICHLSNPQEILNAYQSAEKAWRRIKDSREYKALSQLYKILYELKNLQHCSYLPKSRQSLIQPAIEYIHKKYTDELISAEKLSEMCGISYDYLRKLFEKFYGVSPIKYINQLKLNRAKELLNSGLYSVSDSAFQSGFSDLSHFCRFFKEHVGVSPSEYLKDY